MISLLFSLCIYMHVWAMFRTQSCHFKDNFHCLWIFFPMSTLLIFLRLCSVSICIFKCHISIHFMCWFYISWQTSFFHPPHNISYGPLCINWFFKKKVAQRETSLTDHCFRLGLIASSIIYIIELHRKWLWIITLKTISLNLSTLYNSFNYKVILSWAALITGCLVR